MTDLYTGPGEFLTITDDKDRSVVERHRDRYMKAVQVVEFGAERLRWLDCACGTGYGAMIVKAFHGETHVYVGVDRSAEAIDYARRESRYLRTGYIRADLTRVDSWLPRLGQFDVILSIETLEHLSRGWQEIWIGEAAKALTSDGVFVLACPIGNDGPSDYNAYHVHEPSLDALDTMLARHFKSVSIETEAYVDSGGRDSVQAFAVCRN